MRFPISSQATEKNAAPAGACSNHAWVNPIPPSRGPLVLIRGAGNVGSAVARALYVARLPAVLVQDRGLRTLRQEMSYAPALKDGSADLQGVRAKVVGLEEALRAAASRPSYIPLVLAALPSAVEGLAPTVIVDSCIKGQNVGIELKGSARLTIGIGPRFTAGAQVDIVIESAWGSNLGAIIRRGHAQKRACQPETISGLSWERFARSPSSGVFRTSRRIGEAVQRRSIVGHIDDLFLVAPISGVIRGMLPDGIYVQRGEKFLEIDPRRSKPQFSGISERPLKIASGVVTAIMSELGSATTCLH